MNIGDRVILKSKTLRGKNLLQNRGAAGFIENISHDRPPAIYIRFDREPHRPHKIIEEMMTAWHKAWLEMDFEYWRNWAYATEYNLWVEMRSQDFDIEVVPQEILKYTDSQTMYYTAIHAFRRLSRCWKVLVGRMLCLKK